jgi:hypothetical protein
VLVAAPRQAEALHMIGALASQQRRFEEADARLAGALAVSLEDAAALSTRTTRCAGSGGRLEFRCPPEPGPMAGSSPANSTP